MPILIPDRSGIDYSVAQLRCKGHVGKLKFVLCEVAFSQIVSLSRLIVESQIRLIAVTDEDVVFRIEGVINPGIPTRVFVGKRNDCRRLSAKARDQI